MHSGCLFIVGYSNRDVKRGRGPDRESDLVRGTPPLLTSRYERAGVHNERVKAYEGRRRRS